MAQYDPDFNTISLRQYWQLCLPRDMIMANTLFLTEERLNDMVIRAVQDPSHLNWLHESYISDDFEGFKIYLRAAIKTHEMTLAYLLAACRSRLPKVLIPPSVQGVPAQVPTLH